VDAQPHTVPIALVKRLVELVKRWHVPAADLLSSAGLAESALDNAFDRLPITTMCELLSRARTLTGEPGLGFYLGLQTRITLYGYLGFAALSAPSLREAIELALHFAPTFSTAIRLDLSIDDGLASIRFDENVDLGDARDIVLLSLIVGLKQVGLALSERQASRGAIELAIERPDYYDRFAHLEPNMRFDQPVNRLVFDATTLDLPVATADDSALELARTMCERTLDELGYDNDLAERVRRIVASDGGYHSLDHVAACLHLSPRTLKRRLAAQGLSFSALVERDRRTKAMELLRSSKLSVEDVAERLDYATASSFVRAFHRWTGMTPAGYRRAKRLGTSSRPGAVDTVK
jgi:AraC-like DNA-binding protein